MSADSHPLPYAGDMSSPTGPGRTLRERKRDRTRKALLEAAVDLFERHGYEGTTIADLAAAADIGTRTFFSYFPSKEALLFPEGDARVQAAITAIAARRPTDRPVDILLRGLREVTVPGLGPDNLVDRFTALRLRLIQTVPAVRGHALQLQLEAQRQIATHLHRAFPDDLDEVAAGALVGAFIGAVAGALQTLLDDPAALDDPEHLRARLHHATTTALRPWLAPPA
jgi:AcrR family transcriptional regulator